MSFAVAEDQVIQGFGLQAGIVIISLALALIFTVRLLLKAYADTNVIQERRIEDAKEFGDKIAEPLEGIQRTIQKQGELSDKMYGILNEILLNGSLRN